MEMNVTTAIASNTKTEKNSVFVNDLYQKAKGLLP